MERDKLQILLNDKLLSKTSHIDDEDKCRVMLKMHRYHKTHEKHEDVMIAIEEMAELTQVLSKVKRGKLEEKDIAVMEEIADVRVCLHEIAYYVFDLSPVALDIVHSIYVEKDKNNQGDAAITAMKRMSKLSNTLSKIIINNGAHSKDKLIKKIVKVEVSMLHLIDVYGLDYEWIKYIEDIKMERTKERLKNKTD